MPGSAAFIGKTCRQMPRSAPAVSLRQKQILEMRPDVTIVNIRGTINERFDLVKESRVDGIVVAACALKRLKLEVQKLKISSPGKACLLQGQLAVVGRQR
jgi:porphobilinogen deaminase